MRRGSKAEAVVREGVVVVGICRKVDVAIRIIAVVGNVPISEYGQRELVWSSREVKQDHKSG